MSNDLYEIAQKILEESNGGLDIIYELFPQADTKRQFKLRNERTASANLKKLKDNNWVLTDFGGDDTPKNAIKLYAEENGCEWFEAVLLLAQRYNIPTGASDVPKPEPEFKTYQIHDFKKELNEDGFLIETSDEFTEEELKVLGPFVDKETCKKCNCYKVLSYAFKSKKDGLERIVEIRPKEDFPIFAFVNKHENKTFYKVYQPKSQDKSYRFRYYGGRPSNFVNGMERLKKQYAKNQEEYNKIMNDDTIEEKPKEPKKIDKVLICSGERDALNAASLGYFVLWHNSETAEWTGDLMKMVFQKVDDIINIPDIDTTGITQGKDLAMKYLSLKTLWLPKWLSQRKDWRGYARKDLTDYFFLRRHLDKRTFDKQFRELVATAHPLQFWTEKYTENGVKYDISNTLLYNFLQHNGFYRYEVPGSKSGYCFIKIDGHKVEKIEVEKIYAFIKSFMQNRNLPIGLKDTLMNTTKISEQKLSWLDMIELNFRNLDPHKQVISFSHENWHITAKGITATKGCKEDAFVWENQVIDLKISKERVTPINPKSIKIEEPYFNIFKKGDGSYDIEIKENNCDIFNFLINTSRIHWKKEFIDSWINESQTWEDAYEQEENKKYRKENIINIAGVRLNDIEIEEQKQHLVNKIFAIGYMLHSYKNAGRPWAIYSMENSIVEDDESKGGTGKSLTAKALQYLLNTKYLPARSKDLFSNQFLYDGVTEHTDMIWFDDADRYFNMGNIYSEITGPILVNPKFGTPFTIPFIYSPKIWISSNFSLRDSDASTLRRLLFVAFSDYFHVASDELPGNTPDMVFGNQFFQDWDSFQWNKFFNFMAQCVQFYLSCSDKINPPMEQLNQRNLIAQIGPVFMDWADEFFRYLRRDEHNVVEFEKIVTIDKLKTDKSSLSKITSNKFTKKLKDYCKLNGYEYMPGAKRIQKASELDALKIVDWIAIKVLEDTTQEIENNNDYSLI